MNVSGVVYFMDTFGCFLVLLCLGTCVKSNEERKEGW